MENNLSTEEWESLGRDGYIRLPGAFKNILPMLQKATRELTQQYPYGFGDPRYYTGAIPQPLTKETARPDGRIMIPHIGFRNFDILVPLANSYLHELLERIVGKDFYFSNTWYQEVPPGAGRLGYHKDPRGSISFTILMDDHGPSMGNTCLVPGSHINTPPASYCMADPHAPHPSEVDLIGNAGDLILFSPETWHARSAHNGSQRTCRLFYNFYSRSSRNTTAWASVVDPVLVEQASAKLPPEYAHMFEINPRRSQDLAIVHGSALKSWTYQRSSSEEIFRDFFYAAQTYGRSPENERHPGALLPYTTRLVRARMFSAVEYFSRLKLIPTLKNIFTLCRKKLQTILRKNPRTVAANPRPM
jgi:hypothetical protein